MDDGLDSILDKLDPKTRERFENGEMTDEEMKKLGLEALI